MENRGSGLNHIGLKNLGSIIVPKKEKGKKILFEGLPDKRGRKKEITAFNLHCINISAKVHQWCIELFDQKHLGTECSYSVKVSPHKLLHTTRKDS